MSTTPSGMRLAAMSAYAPRDVWGNDKIAARLRLERGKVDAELRRDRGEGLSVDEAKLFTTSDRWVKRFIGFEERRFCNDGEGTIDLAVRAARKLLETNDHSPSDIDWIIFGSVTSSYLYSPPDAALLQHELGIPVFEGGRPREIKGADVSLACTTWVSSLMISYALIRSGMAKNVLLIGADRMSAALNWRERAFATVLGDAGTATLCTAVPESEDWFGTDQFWGWINGEGAEMIITPVGGSKHPLRSVEDIEKYRHCISMNGRGVREFMVPFLGGPATDAALEKAGWGMEQLDLASLHEANLVLNEAIVKQWRDRGFAGEVLNAGGMFGNTTSASIPLTWVLNAGALSLNKRFGFFGFGGGMSASIALGTIRHPITISTEIEGHATVAVTHSGSTT